MTKQSNEEYLKRQIQTVVGSFGWTPHDTCVDIDHQIWTGVARKTKYLQHPMVLQLQQLQLNLQ